MDKEKLLNYIEEVFVVYPITIRLIGSLYDYLKENIEDLIEILNESGIDLTLEELVEHDVISKEK